MDVHSAPRGRPAVQSLESHVQSETESLLENDVNTGTVYCAVNQGWVPVVPPPAHLAGEESCEVETAPAHGPRQGLVEFYSGHDTHLGRGAH